MNNIEPTFVKVNMNPYGRHIGDCVIRAVSAGLLYGYKTVCELFENKFFKSVGSEDGVSLAKVNEIAKKYKLFKEYDLELKPNWNITARDMEDFRKYTGFNLKFWIKNLYEAGNTSRMLFLSKVNPLNDVELSKNSTNFHCIYANVNTLKYYDTADTGKTIVFDAYEIDSSKRAKKTDKFYYKNELEELRAEDAEYKKSLKFKK